MKDKLPNFLIVGAAKSGTTSLYQYLKQHPEVYMSPLKEPRFITAQFVEFPFQGKGDDKVEKRIVKSFDEYKRLFEGVRNEKAVGEASPDNLYFYEDAIKQIKKFLGDVKIIIILRNPIERAFSHYLMFVKNSREYLLFEDALNAEGERKSKNWSFGWHYKNVGLYYNQVKAYLESFSRVKVYLYDDLETNTLDLIREIFEFLEVDPSFIPDTKHKYNVSGIPKNKFIHNFLTKPNLLKTLIRPITTRFLPGEKRIKLKETLMMKNFEKPQMKPETREYLENLYREDVLKLQDLIHRDLSHWLKE